MDQLYRKTPIMGWASWNCFRTNISEKILKQQADALIETGLADCGYIYLNIDDGFFGGRDADGKLLFHETRFPNGIKPIADYVHSKGMKAGCYSEGGDNTCGFYYDDEGYNGKGVGLYGYEKRDLKMFLEEFGFDFIKVDWCGGVRLGLDEEVQYSKIAKIIDDIRKRTGRCIAFNICRWRFPGEWAVDIADSWRTGADIAPNFKSILNQIDNIKCLRKYCKPGHVNDLDMMQIGNGLTHIEEKTHFIMWCMMSTPLMIGCDLTTIQAETLDILKNKALIALNQDAACQQAYVIKEYRSENGDLIGEIWYKPLQSDARQKCAVAFLNRSESPLEMDLSLTEEACMENIENIFDLYSHRHIEGSDAIQISVLPHDSQVFEISGSISKLPADINAGLVFHPDWSPNEITFDEAQELVSCGALLIDVRSPAEYSASHIDGALNIPHTEIFNTIEVRTNCSKSDPIIMYCGSGKRCAQAKMAVEYLGYNNIYTLKWNCG